MVANEIHQSISTNHLLMTAIHQSSLCYQLWGDHPRVLGVFCPDLSICPDKRRSGVYILWYHPRWAGCLRCGSLISRAGINVMEAIAKHQSQNLTLRRDPTVGAQYRWSANFAPFAPRFWGLLQGKCRNRNKLVKLTGDRLDYSCCLVLCMRRTAISTG